MAEQRVRRATVLDAAELVRLRVVMLRAMGADPADVTPAWQEHAVAVVEGRLSDTDRFAGFVIDAGEGLAACAIAWINHELPSPWSPVGLCGQVANVCTDERFRRRGYARELMLAVRTWLEASGVELARLHATPDAEPLYRSLGWGDPIARAHAEVQPLTASISPSRTRSRSLVPGDASAGDRITVPSASCATA